MAPLGKYLRPLLYSAALFIGTGAGGASAQEAPAFSVPVDCSLSGPCFIQNYVDRQAGEGWRDYRCGLLSYNRHKGTDFRVGNFALYQQGVAVLAAAEGTVLRMRDGEQEGAYLRDHSTKFRGKEAGNGVLIDHGNGWQSLYAHLRRGSVTVKPGQRVSQGAPIGIVGLSGKSEFPHLHFQVLYQGKVVDPFHPNTQPSCSATAPEKTLWHGHDASELGYRQGGLADQGFANQAVTLSGLLDAEKRAALEVTTGDPAALVYWVEGWGLEAGDRFTLRLIDPNGRVRAESKGTIKRHRASALRYGGIKRPKSGWESGLYRGTFTVLRGSGAVSEKIIETESVISVD